MTDFRSCSKEYIWSLIEEGGSLVTHAHRGIIKRNYNTNIWYDEYTYPYIVDFGEGLNRTWYINPEILFYHSKYITDISPMHLKEVPVIDKVITRIKRIDDRFKVMPYKCTSKSKLSFGGVPC